MCLGSSAYAEGYFTSKSDRENRTPHEKVCEDKELCDIFNELKKQENYQDATRLPGSNRKKEKKKKKSELPVHFIDIPAPIRKEKNLVCNERQQQEQQSFDVNTEKTPSRKCYFKQTIKNFKLHKVQAEDLAVVGQAIGLQPTLTDLPESVQSVPEVSVEPPSDDEDLTDGDDNTKSIFCLVINDREVRYEVDVNIQRENLEEDADRTWEVQFGMAQAGNLCENTVVIENKGTVAVSYEWRQKIPVEARQSLYPLQPKRHEPWFFFDKNPGILIPGQKYPIKFYLHPSKSGVRVETWYLKTQPPLFPNSDSPGKFIFTCVATGDDPDAEIRAVERYLKKRTGQSAVREILDHVIYEVVRSDFRLDFIEYRSLMADRELFEYHNSKHYYNSQVVRQLNDIFSEVTCQQQQEWDRSFSTLILAVRTCVADKKSRESLLRRISELAKEVFKPCHVNTRLDKKYRQVYQVLCQMVNRMEADYDSQRWYFARKSTDDDGQPEEVEGTETSTSHSEFGEIVSKTTIDQTEFCTPNLMRFHLMIYIKVYKRICRAAEQVAGIMETNKNLEPWRKRNTRPKGPVNGVQAPGRIE